MRYKLNELDILSEIKVSLNNQRFKVRINPDEDYKE